MMTAEHPTQSDQLDFYQVLHVQPDAPIEIIRTSYRTLMQILAQHPDLGGDTSAAARINEAFDTLKDPARRAAYDRALANEAARERDSHPDRLALPAPRGWVPSHAVTAPMLDCQYCGEPYPELQSRRPDAQCTFCGSPLCAAPSWARSTASRRGIHRTLVVQHVNCELKGSYQPFEAVTENISVAGMRLLSPEPVTVGQVIRMDCDFCAAVGVVKYAAEATRRSRRWWEAGIEFQTVRLKQLRGGLVSAIA